MLKIYFCIVFCYQVSFILIILLCVVLRTNKQTPFRIHDISKDDESVINERVINLNFKYSLESYFFSVRRWWSILSARGFLTWADMNSDVHRHQAHPPLSQVLHFIKSISNIKIQWLLNYKDHYVFSYRYNIYGREQRFLVILK